MLVPVDFVLIFCLRMLVVVIRVTNLSLCIDFHFWNLDSEWYMFRPHILSSRYSVRCIEDNRAICFGVLFLPRALVMKMTIVSQVFPS